MSSFKRAFVRVAPATIVFGVVGEAAANPPPPSTIPDPPLVAPTRAEKPTVLRRHHGVCFEFYPSGGTLAIECPPELLNEPVGEALIKQPTGKCQFIPFMSGSVGRSGLLDKCPPLFDVVGVAGVVPDWSTKLSIERRAPAPEPDPLPVPMPARLGEAPPQQVGCTTGGATAPEGAMAALSMVAVVIGARTRRRKR